MTATALAGATTASTTQDRREWLQHKLNEIFVNKKKSDFLSLDLEMNLLICSAQSYKHESVLKPFPSTFLSDSNNSKNYAQLLDALLSLPPVLEWSAKLKNFSDEQLSVIYWLFVHKSYQLELASIDQVIIIIYSRLEVKKKKIYLI